MSSICIADDDVYGKNPDPSIKTAVITRTNATLFDEMVKFCGSSEAKKGQIGFVGVSQLDVTGFSVGAQIYYPNSQFSVNIFQMKKRESFYALQCTCMCTLRATMHLIHVCVHYALQCTLYMYVYTT